jgi:hypothetical protein
MRENEKKDKVMLLNYQSLVGEWYGCSSWESNIKQNTVFIHCLMQINSTIRRTNKDGSINTRPDWLRIYSYSRFSKTTIETGPADSTETPWYVYVRTKVVNIRNLNFGKRNWIR